MDNDRFDALARALAARLARRGLAAGLFAALVPAASDAKERRGKRGRTGADKRRRGGNDAGRHGGDDAEQRGGERGTKPREDRGVEGPSAVGKRKPPGRKKPTCVKPGGSCKKPKRGKAKKCCAGLACDAKTKRCVGRGSTPIPCTDCSRACQVCDLDAGRCTQGCAGDACDAVRRTCMAVTEGSTYRELANHLGGLGFAPRPNPRAVVVREGAAVAVAMVETTFATAGAGPTAILRIASRGGESVAVALVMLPDGRVDYGLFVDDGGRVQRLDADDGGAGVASESRRAGRAAGTADEGCESCKLWCNRLGANAVCYGAGALCANLPAPAPHFWALKFLTCAILIATMCQESGAKTCEVVCRGQCGGPCGAGGVPCPDASRCCDQSKCERCVGGRCSGCGAGTYCRAFGPAAAPHTYCAPCPTCRGVCEVRTGPPDNAAGTQACPALRCGGSCSREGDLWRCEDGECTCSPRTAAAYCAQGMCGSYPDGCGGQLDCGGCAHGMPCDSGLCRVCTPPSFPCNGACCAVTQTCTGGACRDCAPSTCAELGFECGTHRDGCGGSIDCGECASANRPNAVCLNFDGRCSCEPSYCGQFGRECGDWPDGCGGTLRCGNCANDQRPKAVCTPQGQCSCTPDTCASLGMTCGVWPDGCGGTVDCGDSALLCGTAEAPVCCDAGQACCGSPPLAGICCAWPSCERWPGGAQKGCCPPIQQCVEADGGKTCCPEGWTCREDPNHVFGPCCVRSTYGDASVNQDPRVCCSGRATCTAETGCLCD